MHALAASSASTLAVDYHDGLRYPHLERVAGSSDRLKAPRSRRAAHAEARQAPPRRLQQLWRMTEMTDEERSKRDVAYHAVDTLVRNGTCIGLGTGSTAYWAIVRVGELVAKGWNLCAVGTSLETERLCREHGIGLVDLLDEPIDVAIDGADETAPDFSLIKGGGGALFRERAVALVAKTFVVVVSERKLVPKLGAFPLPVEVVPFASRYVARELADICPKVTPRERCGAPFVTDNGNAILDCAFGTIEDPAALDAHLRAIHGVVTTGLFTGLASQVLVGTGRGVESLTRKAGS